MEHPDLSGTKGGNHGKIQSNIERDVCGLCAIPLEFNCTPVVGQLFLLAYWHFFIFLGARNFIPMADKTGRI